MPGDLSDLDALYDLDLAPSERVMPRGERERRQAVLETARSVLQAEREREEQEIQVAEGEREGLVIEVSSGLCRVDLDGQILLCGVRGTLNTANGHYTNVVAVGDRVLVTAEDPEAGIVEAVLPRHSVLARPDVFHHHLKQVVVANADQLLIVASWRDPKLWPELVDRYLIAAERNGLRPIICVNKVDLAADAAECRREMAPYLDLGYRVLYTSALTGSGIEPLQEILHEQVTVLAGMSGVGKSTLLNAVQPGLSLRTRAVSDFSHTGRHTTAQVNLLRLDMGGCVVDTPGIREFGLDGLHRGELVSFYPEIAALEGGCRFGDCAHTHEPGCAVQEAADRGAISAQRLKNYQQIYAALPKDQAQEHAQVQARTRHKV